MVSRLVPYKNIDIIVKAFNNSEFKLKIIGVGNQLGYLKRIAGSNIEFLGQLSDEELVDYYQNCQALVMATEEDFGLTCVEVQAVGRPVIAFKAGGALDSVIAGKTGLFFDKLSSKNLRLALSKFKGLKFRSLDCKKNAQRFSKEIFIKKLKSFVEDKWKQKQMQK